MRLCSIIILGLIAGASLSGSPGYSQDVAFNWSVPTNDWPEKLWSYKVIPQKFSPSVISNLLALAEYTEKDRSEVPDYISEHDKDAVFYGTLEGTCKHLAISPALGFIDYLDPKVEASSQLQKVEGVPNEQETTQLGLKYLRLLGIDISQIARNPTNGALDLHWEKGTIGYIDQTTKKEVTLTNNYGVFFNRRIDGVNFGGKGLWGGVRVRFGNNGKVNCLQVSWRNLQPYELRECPTLQEIAEQITVGKITLFHLGTKTAYPTKQLKQLTITKATPIYVGSYMDKPMDFARPYANFQATADDGQTKNGVYFDCPLVK